MTTPLTVLSLGSINADFQMRVDHPPGSRDLLYAHDFVRLSGGKSANTAFIAASFGHRSLLLGRVGDDQLAEQALGTLAASGVDIAGVSLAAGQSTAVSVILVPPGAKKQIVLATNANDCWDDEAIEGMLETIHACTTPACLIINCEIPAAVVRRAVGTARQKSIPVVLDPSFAERVEPDIYPLLQAIMPNVAEAEVLLGRPIKSLADAGRAACELRERGVAAACIKLAEGGCVIATHDDVVHIPPGDDIEPIDTTGAGDAFTSAFSIATLERVGPIEAAAWGVAAADLATLGYGSQPSYRSREEITTMAQQLLEKMRTMDVRALK